jgi:hypothetical protein
MIKELLKWLGVFALCFILSIIVLLLFGWDSDASAQSNPGAGAACQAAALGAVLDDHIVTPDEVPVILAACTQEALEQLGASPVGCHRDRPDDVTCGYPRRSAKRHPAEFARYNRVRARLIRCRYQQMMGVRLPQCRRLYRQFEAKWVEGEGVRDPDKPEQVRFNLQHYDWVA